VIPALRFFFGAAPVCVGGVMGVAMS
jgi:hypothetical protein